MKKLRNIDYAKTSREQNIKGALKERRHSLRETWSLGEREEHLAGYRRVAAARLGAEWLGAHLFALAALAAACFW